ncbi:MAG: endonuclease/exonuclease/phosphatase family protein [Sphaerochaetaceae bacterium]
MIRRYFKKEILLLIVGVSLLFSCSLLFPQPDENKITVMTYNVQNLFDCYDNGNEYPEFKSDGGWNCYLYNKRLETISQAIIQYCKTVPSILLLQEVENSQVIEDLITKHLGKWDFKYYVITNDTFSPIQVAILSKYPIVQTFNHAVLESRSVLECTVDIGGSLVTLFNIHAKSRIGGIKETEAQRRESAYSIIVRCSEILNKSPFHPIIIGGDFNESVDSVYKDGSSFNHALVPYGHPCADEKSLIITGTAPQKGHWYSWYLDKEAVLKASANGSYCYNGIWESFDQLLLSSAFFDYYDLEFSCADVCYISPLINEKGLPNTYNIKSGKGYSDHLPVTVTLKKL